MDKLKNLFNVKAWFENIVAKFILNKGVKHGTAAIVGLLGTAVFAAKVKPILDQLGISINQEQLTAGLTVMLTGAAGALINTIQRVMNHE